MKRDEGRGRCTKKVKKDSERWPIDSKGEQERASKSKEEQHTSTGVR